MGLVTTDYQVGVIATLADFPDKVVLVTNRDGDRWIFPKGRIERGRTDRAIAIEEAYEEAGVIGELLQVYREIETRNSKARSLRLFRMQVTTVLKDWPEMRSRKRVIVSFDKAEEMLERELVGCLRWETSW